MHSFLTTAFAALLFVDFTASAFTVPKDARPATSLNMVDEPSRRTFLSNAAFTSAAIAAGASTGSLVQGPTEPAHAIGGGGFAKVNARLNSYGLPPMNAIPSGFSPLLEIWGKGRNRTPLLVNFAHPLDWVVTLPSQDVNGEDGTIQAGEYAKGDTATLFVYADPGKVKDIGSQPKKFFEEAIIKAISQKGANIYQDFKVIATETVKGEYKNQEYVLVDFKYTLLTGAGFEVQRRGVASVTSEGDAVEVLWTATIAARFKKLEPNLRSIAQSFRCYADGLDLIAPGRNYDDDLA